MTGEHIPPREIPATLNDPTNQPEDERQPEEGIGLCLSGGGYRAMLFHLGTLWRLDELGLLQNLNRISSVSGGSITAAVLALAWNRLRQPGGAQTGFATHVVAPLRALAGRTIDRPSVLKGLLLPGTISDRIVAAYRKHLFGDATLQDLPDEPRFVFNATNIQTAALWRFSRPYMGDWRVGRIFASTTAVAVAVAASSAFPPFLSPVRIALDPGSFEPDPDADFQRPPFTQMAILSDGGVYDNLGLETVWKRYRTVLVSDAGMNIVPDARPPTDWAFGSKWVAAIIDSQVRALRRRQLIGSFVAPQTDKNWRKGTYWSVRSDVTHYPAKSTLPCPVEATSKLAAVPTGLSKLDATVQERLINWGYAMCDIAIRSHVDAGIPAATSFPYPAGV